MNLRIAGAAFGAAAGLASCVAMAGSAPNDVTALARPAVDSTLFRDGEVRRRNEMHGRWSLDCDEIPRLAQRFCSLRSLALDGAGVPVARITVSTDDQGRPAALIDLPVAISLIEAVSITADHGVVLGQPTKALEADARRVVAKGLAATHGTLAGTVQTGLLSARLTPDLCDARGCHAVWVMRPADVAALRAGAGLRIRFSMSASPGYAFPFEAALPSRSVDAVVSSDGFGDAIAASVR